MRTQLQVKEARQEEGKTTKKSVGKNNRYKKMKIQKGKAEGILESKLVMASQMKKEGLDSSLIEKITGLSIDEINQI